MKIKTKITIIECSADELRQSSSLSDSFLNLLRNAFNGPILDDEESEGVADENQDQETN